MLSELSFSHESDLFSQWAWEGTSVFSAWQAQCGVCWQHRMMGSRATRPWPALGMERPEQGVQDGEDGEVTLVEDHLH